MLKNTMRWVKDTINRQLKDVDHNDAGWTRLASAGGGTVGERKALGLATVYACVRALSETYASLPIFVYERSSDRSKKRALKHPVYKLLHDQPNEEMTPFILKQSLMTNLQLFGNAYALIGFDAAWRPNQIYPLLADRTHPKRNQDTGKIEYHTILHNGRHFVFQSYEILHFKGFGFDGIRGYSPLELQMQTMTGGVAVQQYGNKFFEDGAKPSGVLQTDNKLSDKAFDRLKKDIEEKYNGLENSHKTMILEEGLNFKYVTLPPEAAQFIETKKMSALDICRIFKVPPHVVGILDNATFSNIEHQSIQYATNTMLPLATMSEEEFENKLLTGKERQRYLIEQNIDAIIRGDMKSRYEAYAIGKQNGFLSTNDIRGKENMNEIDGGDTYIQPLNSIPSNMSETFWQSKINATNKTVEGGEENGKQV